MRPFRKAKTLRDLEITHTNPLIMSEENKAPEGLSNPLLQARAAHAHADGAVEQLEVKVQQGEVELEAPARYCVQVNITTLFSTAVCHFSFSSFPVIF